MKKLLTILLVAGLITCLFVGCTPPTVPSEGEGEPEQVDRVVLVELFMAKGCPICEGIEPILEQLADEYNRSELILVEEAVWGGVYATTENKNRFKWYFPNSEGVPYTAFNGLNKQVKGTSNYSTFKSYINAELAKEARITITADRSNDSSTTTITGSIKNISDAAISNLVINGMIFKDRGMTGFKYSVFDIFEENKVTISSLSPDASYSFSFTLEDINWVANKIHGVIFVQDVDSSTKEILQAFYVD
ncbi:hypothetical protein CVT91_06600 [Candidatus Atribacteria bacterium HGW-Atribacteria-1]|nr:MAG: hypothetical protein CVT91_06600 [Candidatus Atribacteria bacterium HGW-Atribacteria-1]